jgi:hypothetical protein
LLLFLIFFDILLLRSTHNSCSRLFATHQFFSTRCIINQNRCLSTPHAFLEKKRAQYRLFALQNAILVHTLSFHISLRKFCKRRHFGNAKCIYSKVTVERLLQFRQLLWSQLRWLPLCSAAATGGSCYNSHRHPANSTQPMATLWLRTFWYSTLFYCTRSKNSK